MTVAITVALSDDETEVVALVRRLGLFASDVDVVKVALWKLAAHFDVPMEPDCFALDYRRDRVVTPPEERQPDLFDVAEAQA